MVAEEYSTTPTLTGTRVALEPLAHTHAADLAEAVAVDALWRTWYTHIPAPESMEAEIDRRLGLQTLGRMAPWAVRDLDSGRTVGMTSYCTLDPANRRVEIGSTWLGAAFQRTGVNTEAKRMLLERAFDTLGCLAVEFRAHWHNRQSRAAIERLGAKQDGVLRKHTVFENGTVRDTVVYSILDDEWPTVRFGLDAALERRR
ncbi:GNAT family N-acetyltransferase [Herbiconiux moechotypicola]|uniref:GNAT family protein n=1 Tax=Herbiconiux moechotypicola TaxID=637393 RepID=A0ABN3D9G9_9MICO|nr:GNAT family protein [Herbiconiux moechotypicola]MCS5729100.1 GNAT family N-acetyltransferase [Herbiconiux moechotypicola]